MVNEIENRAFPGLAIPPGELLEEEIAIIGMTQHELADRSGRPVQVINEIIRGKKAITHDTALELEKVLGIPAHVWVNLQANYDLANARIRELNELSEQEDCLKEFPVREMEKRGWIKRHSAKSDKVRAVLGFLGVASFPIWRQSAQELLGFRISQGSKVSLGALAIWLRKGELEGQAVETEPYDEGRFWEVLGEIRSLTNEPPEIFEPKMRELCAGAGVAIVFIPELPKSGANGAARWLKKDKGLIQLSLKYRWNDIFWFSFFHEACHILRHRIRYVYIDGVNGDPESEREADEFARDFLISPEAWERFIDSGVRDPIAVRRFASEVCIAPGIIVGRMQHEELLPHSHLNGLRERFVWNQDADGC